MKIAEAQTEEIKAIRARRPTKLSRNPDTPERRFEWKLIKEAYRKRYPHFETEIAPHLLDRQREIFALRYGFIEGDDHVIQPTYREIGERFGMTRQGVQDLLFRCEKNIHKILLGTHKKANNL